MKHLKSILEYSAAGVCTTVLLAGCVGEDGLETVENTADVNELIAPTVDERVAPPGLEFVGMREKLSFAEQVRLISEIAPSDADGIKESMPNPMNDSDFSPGLTFFHRDGSVYRSSPYNVKEKDVSESFSPVPLDLGLESWNRGQLEESDSGGMGYTIHGEDDRLLSTSKKQGFAAVKVSLRYGKEDSASIQCSGALVAPRVVLTAAHCIAPEGADGKFALNDVYVAGRGEEYDGDVSPYGVQRPEWAVVSSGWKGKNKNNNISPRFDYGFLVLPDARWDRYPGWVQSGIENTQFRTLYHHGYPGTKKGCADSPLQSGLCGGYGYHEKRKTGFSFIRFFKSKHDVQVGQSGGPYYLKKKDYVGGRKVVGVQSTQGNTAHRLNKWSFSDLCEVLDSKLEGTDGKIYSSKSSYHSNARCR